MTVITIACDKAFAVWPRTYRANPIGAILLADLRAHPLILPCSHPADPILEADGPVLGKLSPSQQWVPKGLDSDTGIARTSTRRFAQLHAFG